MKYSAHFVAYFFFKQRDIWARFWSVFKVGEQVSVIFSIHRFLLRSSRTSICYFFDSQIFLRSSRYFSTIVISINFYHVECGDGRQPRILVDQNEFRGPKHVRFPLPGFSQSRVITFFRIITSLCLFSFQSQNNFICLMDIHVQHLASLCRICGDEIEDHKRKVDREDLMLLDSPNVHPPLKNNQRNKANLNCKCCISLLIEHALILQQAKKAPDA